MINGIKTKFYVNVKMPVKAGMQFGSNDYKLKTVGYEVFRQYFDTIEKDMQVGVERVKRIIY